MARPLTPTPLLVAMPLNKELFAASLTDFYFFVTKYDGALCKYLKKPHLYTMVLILDCNSEHVAHERILRQKKVPMTTYIAPYVLTYF